ncbi:MAG: DUF1330 domain-containing protein [Sterolibacteriaceae bacterium]|uniref:DUF1330 domain-containing protein n=1 Tax=Sulfuritalea sp. TaxID=2480090 RepID=UPI001A607BF6|nr:DUF1330 domain-containing protein [Sulfuritalea sp.]MBL8480205.1 DUF1330 domain-containing protein [Sterolibacteriaceae bacterium]MBN8474359.1 DUF1330 domain-containing protein [Sulfuritalea sp.]
MSKLAYMVVDARSSDPDRMVEYRRLAQIAVAHYGGRYLVRGAAYETLEGSWQPQRLVVLEFPSMAAARAFYDSPEYRAAREARAGVSDFDILLVDAY